jgi:hypothetical protein
VNSWNEAVTIPPNIDTVPRASDPDGREGQDAQIPAFRNHVPGLRRGTLVESPLSSGSTSPSRAMKEVPRWKGFHGMIRSDIKTLFSVV